MPDMKSKELIYVDGLILHALAEGRKHKENGSRYMKSIFPDQRPHTQLPYPIDFLSCNDYFLLPAASGIMTF